MFKKSLFLVIILAFAISTFAQGPKNAVPTISMDYDASPAYPFGRLNPKAPPETKQFDFMIGEFDCVDRIKNPEDGKWYNLKAVRRAAYVLNGYAIQDRNWTPILNSTNLRVYNSKTKQWEVNYFKSPQYYAGVWKGGKEGENIVLKQVNGKTTSRLSFFNIGKDSYSWKAESVTDGKASLGWEFTCKRRR